MWRRFMQSMVTIAAILIVIVSVILGIAVGEHVNGGVGFCVFAIILIGGFLLIGTTGMIAEGVGYLETISYAATHGNQNGYPYSQSTGGYGPSSSQGGSVAVSNAKGKSILEAVQEENRMQFHSDTPGRIGGWMCSKCGEKNEEGNTYCKYCGTHK